MIVNKFIICSIVGARPQFIKLAAVCRALEEHNDIHHIIVHSGQHYDHGLSGQFFLELGIPQPDYNLGIGSQSHNAQIASCILKIDEVFNIENPDLVIVYGDTNTTAAAAIAAAKRNIKLAHIEAGLREFDKSIPEEVNKLITDSVTDLYFTPTETGKMNLKDEGKIENVFVTGDISLDLLYKPKFTSILQRLDLESGAYFFMTCHRAANTDNVENLSEIISAINRIEEKVVFAIHPRTSSALEKNHFEITNPQVVIINDLGFWDTQTLIKNAKFVITDSGGIIKEAYFHKVPAVIIDTQTEWVETVEEGWNTVAGPNKIKILDAIINWQKPDRHCNCLSNGNAGRIIVTEILKYLNV